jgi:hypothetical protein
MLPITLPGPDTRHRDLPLPVLAVDLVGPRPTITRRRRDRERHAAARPTMTSPSRPCRGPFAYWTGCRTLRRRPELGLDVPSMRPQRLGTWPTESPAGGPLPVETDLTSGLSRRSRDGSARRDRASVFLTLLVTATSSSRSGPTTSICTGAAAPPKPETSAVRIVAPGMSATRARTSCATSTSVRRRRSLWSCQNRALSRLPILWRSVKRTWPNSVPVEPPPWKPPERDEPAEVSMYLTSGMSRTRSSTWFSTRVVAARLAPAGSSTESDTCAWS